MDSLFFQKEKIGLKLPIWENQTIFYCVLNWGIGHATRSIPIIKAFLNQGNKVIVFSDGEAETLLKKTFPELIVIALPSYKIQYKSKRFLLIAIILQSLTRFWVIRKENKVLHSYVQEYSPDIVISDNRYGCYIYGLKNYLITHQLKLVTASFIERISPKFIDKLIRPFEELWIPDIEEVKLSGDMTSVDFPIQKRWIGFPDTASLMSKEYIEPFDILILLSGPEPRRTELDNLYRSLLPSMREKVVFIAGNFSQPYFEEKKEGYQYYSFKKYEEVLAYINKAKLIVCRSGYSTLIDLYVLKKDQIVCVPTAGQPEQEYLAEYWREKGWIQSLSEKDLKEKLLSMIENM